MTGIWSISSRNTPTCVGKTQDSQAKNTRMWKHPHVRGEDMDWRFACFCPLETPPRAWGRLTSGRSVDFLTRNTPTCVGKTPYKAGNGRIQGKHPHVRGEDEMTRPACRPPQETPPRAWGRPLFQHFLKERIGNTPTCVGKTCPCRTAPWRAGKHPHVRGEDCRYGGNSNDNQETPPRAWGRPSQTWQGSGLGRNTPTCVGKTGSTGMIPGTAWKHPHVRGEDTSPSADRISRAETPPRAWGRRKEKARFDKRDRNTPTCVGKTLRDYSLFLLSRQNNIETSSFSDTSCSPDNSMSWRFGSPMP